MPDDLQRTENTDTRNTHEDSDSLRLYYRQLSDSEPLSPEEELTLWQGMEQCTTQIRFIFARFGFILLEHVRMYRAAGPEGLSDYFCLFRDNAVVSPPPIAQMNTWASELEALHKTMAEAFTAGKERKLEQYRKKAGELLSRFPALSDRLYEWQNVANVYRTQLRFSTAQDEKAQIEEKLLMREDLFLKSMEELDSAFEKMENYRKHLLTANLRLVVSIVRPFRRNGIQTGDLIQEGNLGLIHALERFDYKLGHRFSTYATWWIKQAVSKAINSQSRIIRLPEHMLASISRIKRAERNFVQENGRDPSADELANVLEMPRERVNAIRKMAEQSISLQAPLSQETDSPSIEQFLCDEDDNGPVRQLAFKFMRDLLGKALEHLTEREQQIITLRFGLAGKKAMTLIELSELFGLTRERVRQLEVRAIRKLRDPNLSDYFQDHN